MRFDIQIGESDPEHALRTYVRRRVGFAIGRFSLSIRRVTVRVTWVNATRGGVDLECRITAELSRRSPIVLIERAPDIHAAIDRSVERLGRRLARRVDRGRSH